MAWMVCPTRLSATGSSSFLPLCRPRRLLPSSLTGTRESDRDWPKPDACFPPGSLVGTLRSRSSGCFARPLRARRSRSSVNTGSRSRPNYGWKSKCGGMEVSHSKRLNHARDREPPAQSLDKQMLPECWTKGGEARCAQAGGALASQASQRERAEDLPSSADCLIDVPLPVPASGAAYSAGAPLGASPESRCPGRRVDRPIGAPSSSPPRRGESVETLRLEGRSRASSDPLLGAARPSRLSQASPRDGQRHREGA